jgi:DNA-binding transcriptional LysR family regulator
MIELCRSYDQMPQACVEMEIFEALGPLQLRLIAAIAELGSINRAAARLGQSQPAASMAVQRIERTLGGVLFERSPRGCRPTRLGEYIAKCAHILLADDMTRPPCRPRHTRIDGTTLRLACQICPPVSELALRIPAILPDCDTDMTITTGFGWLARGLRQGKFDITVLVEPYGFPNSLPAGVARRVVVERMPSFVGLAATNPLANLEVIPLKLLHDQNWMVNPPDDSGWWAQFSLECRQTGFKPRVRYRGFNLTLTTRVVSSGQAVAMFFPAATADENIVLRRIKNDPIGSRLSIAWCPGFEKHANTIWHELRQCYRELLTSAPHVRKWLQPDDSVELPPC